MALNRRPRKKKDNPDNPDSGKEDAPQNPPKEVVPELSPDEIKEQKKLLMESALLAFQTNATTAYKNDMNHLASMVSEYLSPFMIVGYNTKGKSIVMFSTKSMMEEDALVEAVKNAYGQYLNKLKQDEKDTNIG